MRSGIWEKERTIAIFQKLRDFWLCVKWPGGLSRCQNILEMILLLLLSSTFSFFHHCLIKVSKSSSYSSCNWRKNLFKKQSFERNENDRFSSKLKIFFQTPSNYKASKISTTFLHFLVKDSKLIDIVEYENISPSLEWHLCQQRRLAWKLHHLPPWL